MSKKISQLPASTDVYDGCCMPIVTNDETKKMTYALLKEKLQEDLHLLDVDDALSESSENPVKNKVVTEKINEINFKATQAVVAAGNAASQAAMASDSASNAKNAAEEAKEAGGHLVVNGQGYLCIEYEEE